MAERDNIRTIDMSELPIWEDARRDRALLSIVLELTARCNNDCAHCYINIGAGDKAAQEKELRFKELQPIIDEAIEMGVLWFLLSGGEVLLHPDFLDIYEYIKKKGALVSLFTNASLITKEYIELFKKYPPRDIEVTVYGVTEKIHARVTGRQTFAATLQGIDLLLANFPVTLKTTVMRSNLEEFDQIKEFCSTKTSQPFRYDPFLQFRLDGDREKNEKIVAQRLRAEEIFAIEQRDPVLQKLLLEKSCGGERGGISSLDPHRLFRCQVGRNSCCIDYQGRLKLCSALDLKSCTVDLKEHSLRWAWEEVVPKLMKMRSEKPAFIKTCGSCDLHESCSWCPAHAVLETGELDGHLPYFCEIAQKRNE